MIQDFIEKYAFGVCTKIGEKFHLPTATIRMYFIYASFLTFGSPVLIYLSLAYWMSLRKMMRRRNNSLWYY